jgi:catechol 2,3-dioxygenase-like lactoylglutathione lyase family enzyme
MQATGVDHLDLVVSDLERSLEFYRALLEPLGYGGRTSPASAPAGG